MAHKEPLLVVNILALGITLTLFLSIVIILYLVFRLNAGMVFGMMFAFLFPILAVLAAAVSIGYIALLAVNVGETILRIRAGTNSGPLLQSWLAFSGVTAFHLTATAIFALISAPLVILWVGDYRATNPFLTAPVRSFPAYPTMLLDDQSRYDDINQTFFRSYNVPNVHPGEVASWYQDALSQQPWSVIQVNEYKVIEDESIYLGYCVQAERNENDAQPMVYFVEIMGKDSNLDWVHVNIGTPKPITDTCQRFSDPQE